jgi:surface polysaccharide O-acyltransferase-like enzyme
MALVIYVSGLPLMSGIMPAIWDMWPIYESFMAVFLCIGLLIFFREYCNRSNTLLQKLAQNAFGAYVIHNFFVVLFQISFDSVPVGGSIKFLSVSALSIICSFGVSFLFREAMRIIRKQGKVDVAS